MIKKLDNMVDIYEDNALRYDYFNRILASFAEIYNYDYSVSSLMEDGSLYDSSSACIRCDGIKGRIRAFYERHMNECEVNTKLYYNEVVYSGTQRQEYGYLTLGNVDEATMADMISLSVRFLEACGLKDFTVFLDLSSKYHDGVIDGLDALDINYVEKNIDTEYEDVAFEICIKNTFNKEVSLIKGGLASKFSEMISGLHHDVFVFSGTLEDLNQVTYDTIKLDEKILDVVITYGNHTERDHALYLGQELRLNGFKTEVIPRCEKSFIKKYYNTKYVISLKDEDVSKDEILLVDLYTNEKEKVKELDLVHHLDINF